MELAGDEKRIQALFSELSFENKSRVPQFVWPPRAAAPPREKTRIKPVAVLVSLMVTAAVCSLAVWSWSISTQTPNIAIQLPQLSPGPVKLQQPAVQPSLLKRVTRRRSIDRSIATQAALLSKWQSPTQQFMASPTDLALRSLPVLNQSAKDLESFLSKNTEIMKESNR